MGQLWQCGDLLFLYFSQRPVKEPILLLLIALDDGQPRLRYLQSFVFAKSRTVSYILLVSVMTFVAISRTAFPTSVIVPPTTAIFFFK